MSDVREASDDVRYFRDEAERARRDVVESWRRWGSNRREVWEHSATDRNAEANVLDAAADALEENVLLRAALAAQCWEHAGNCCASWCEACRAGVAALDALDARRAVRS